MEIEGQKLHGIFLRRLNRFLAEVDLGYAKTMVHVPNPARLSELLAPGADVLIREGNINRNDNRKTKHTLFAARYKGILVGIDSRMPNHIFESSLHANLLEEFSQWSIKKKDFHYKDSRIDYLLEKRETDGSFSNRRKMMLLEIKSCSLVIDKVALFPDVPTIRGLRQIRTMIDAVTHGFISCVLWIVQREDAEYLTPYIKIQPELEGVLEKGVKNGLHLFAYKAKVEANSISIIGRIPVKLRGKTVNE